MTLEENLSPEEEMTLEEAYQKLDALMAVLEDSGSSLEDSFQAYREGVRILKVCQNKIDLIEKKVLTLNEEGEIGEL
ncbi:MAG: exodeoxyribonuclease VII small subunit [Lachnospiraceae bacterium]|nr:exodeoxyribonuclease VII small subunit [Lachnospiraceae bacterium]